MKRLLSALAALLLVAAAAPAAEGKKVTIRWHGQSFFEITSSKGTNIVIDPHAIPEFGRVVGVKADLILNTHPHPDHVQYQVVENYKERVGKRWPKARLIEGIKRQGTSETWNKIDETFKDFHIRSVGTYHDESEGMERGKNTVYILDVDGMHIVHLGDLGHKLSKAQIRAIGPVDVLFIPVGGVYTINGDEAKEVVGQLKPKKYIIPMHYGNRIYDDLMPAKEFLEDQPRGTVARSADNVLRVKADFKPARPIIVVLNWEPAPIRRRGD